MKISKYLWASKYTVAFEEYQHSVFTKLNVVWSITNRSKVSWIRVWKEFRAMKGWECQHYLNNKKIPSPDLLSLLSLSHTVWLLWLYFTSYGNLLRYDKTSPVNTTPCTHSTFTCERRKVWPTSYKTKVRFVWAELFRRWSAS